MMIKVCGLTDNESSHQIAALNAVDFLGFIFYKNSKRFTEKTIDSQQKYKVGVFVNEESAKIIDLVSEHQLTHIQLHGNETADFCKNLLTNAVKLKAFGIATRDDFDATKSFENSVDYFLFDTKTSDHGGSGKQFDWTILDAYTGETPFFLSGGIGPESIEEIKQIKHPKLVGIDINSRFEIEPSVKDFNRIKSFVEEMKTI